MQASYNYIKKLFMQEKTRPCEIIAKLKKAGYSVVVESWPNYAYKAPARASWVIISGPVYNISFDFATIKQNGKKWTQKGGISRDYII